MSDYCESCRRFVPIESFGFSLSSLPFQTVYENTIWSHIHEFTCVAHKDNTQYAHAAIYNEKRVRNSERQWEMRNKEGNDNSNVLHFSIDGSGSGSGSSSSRIIKNYY